MNLLKNERLKLVFKSSLISIIIAHSIFFFNSYYMSNNDCYIIEGTSVLPSLGRFLGYFLQELTMGLGFITVIKPANFIISMIFIILIIMLIIELLDIKNKTHIILFSVLFPLQPCVISMLGYIFVSHFDYFSNFLMILATYLMVKKKNIIFPIILIIISLGIYQAFLPLAICIIYIYIFKKIILISMEKSDVGGFSKQDFIDIGREIFRYIIIFLIGIIIYIIANRISLNFLDIDMKVNYQNLGENVISDIGIIGYFNRIIMCYKNVFNIFANGYGHICELPIMSYILFIYIAVFLIILFHNIFKKKIIVLPIIFLLLISPIVFDFSYFMAGTSTTRVQTALYFIILLPIIIDDIFYKNVNYDSIRLFFVNNFIKYFSIIIVVFAIFISIAEHYSLYMYTKDYERNINYIVNSIITNENYKDGMNIFTVGEYDKFKNHSSAGDNRFFNIHDKPGYSGITWEYAIEKYFSLYGSIRVMGKCTVEKAKKYVDKPSYPEKGCMWVEGNNFLIKFSD